MAADDNSVMDMPAHRKTYDRVIKLLFRGAIVCFFIAMAVIWLISHK